MREQKVDVDLVIPWKEVVMGGGFEAQMAEYLRRARAGAQAKAEEVRGEVRATTMPEVVVRQAQSPLLGDVFVIGTRWICDVPEAADTPAER